MKHTNYSQNTINLVIFLYSIQFLLMGTTLIVLIIPLTYVLCRPFGKRWFRKILSYSEQFVYLYCLFPFNYLTNVEMKFYADADVHKRIGREKAFMIMNHPFELDWMVSAQVMNHFNVLTGTKLFIVKSVKSLPIIGWLLGLFDFGFVTRSYEEDRKEILRVAKLWSEYEDPVVVGLFPEGTRFTKEGRDVAREFAKERGLDALEYHLIPRTKGFTTAFPILRHFLAAVYDIQMAFDKSEPSIVNGLNGAHIRIHVYIRRIPIGDVPESKEELEVFLHETFKKKDVLMKNFHKTESFLECSGIDANEVLTIKNSMAMSMKMLFSTLILTSFLIFGFWQLFAAQQYYIIAVVVTLLMLWYYKLMQFVEITMKIN